MPRIAEAYLFGRNTPPHLLKINDKRHWQQGPEDTWIITTRVVITDGDEGRSFGSIVDEIEEFLSVMHFRFVQDV